MMIRNTARAVLAVAVLAILGFAAAPARAADAPTEVFASFNLVDAKDSFQSRTFGADLAAPLTTIFSIGPVIQYDYIHPSDAEPAPAPPAEGAYHQPPAKAADSIGSTTVWSVGGQAVLYTNKKHEGLGFSLVALFPQGDTQGGTLQPGAFFMFGNEKVAARIRGYHVFQYNYDGGSAIDLERNVVDAAIGIRF